MGLSIVGIGLVLAGISASLLLKDYVAAGDLGGANLSAIPMSVHFSAPELSLRDLSGRQGALSGFRGRVVLVNLWAAWCPPCKAEMPALQEFHESYREAGFTVLAVNDGESRSVVQRFVDERGLSFPVWLDPTYEASDVAFRSSSLPSSYVIDRSGVVRLMWVGPIDVPMLEKHVLPIIEE
jgi:cytochrome c biogenesis protein CcmG/thiol:disulfide interchange protein DsbE